jgi:hypothetical protein
MFGALTGIGLADTWNGTLLDASCLHRHHSSKSCDAKPSTVAYVLDVNGTCYRPDARSNDETKSAMESRADKAPNPDATKAVRVHAEITGHMRSNGKIRADIVAVQ